MPTTEEVKELEIKTAKKPAVKKPRAVKKATDEKGVAETPAVETAEATVAGGAYLFALGRRKTSIARVRLIKVGKGLITVNGKPMEKYFTTYELRAIVTSPLKMTAMDTVMDVSAEVEGGGTRGQAESVRLGISRALCELNPIYRKTLKKLGFLTRDPRAKERKKPGLKRARRAPQWSKR